MTSAALIQFAGDARPDYWARNQQIISRHKAGERQCALAGEFGISNQRVSEIIHRKPQKSRIAKPAIENRVTADSLFQLGYDTVVIAEMLGLTEAQADRQLTMQRSRRLGHRNPYKALGK